MLSGTVDMDIGADAKGGRDHAPQRSRREGRSSIKAEKIGDTPDCPAKATYRGESFSLKLLTVSSIFC